MHECTFSLTIKYIHHKFYSPRHTVHLPVNPTLAEHHCWPYYTPYKACMYVTHTGNRMSETSHFTVCLLGITIY